MAYNKIGRANEIIVIPGAYGHLVDKESQHRGPDPRVYVSPTDVVTVVNRAPSALQRKLDRGEPVVVPGWRLPGGRALRRQHPELCGRAAVRVFPDDRVEPTEDTIDATTAPAGRSV
jgi:hypothetical protein